MIPLRFQSRHVRAKFLFVFALAGIFAVALTARAWRNHARSRESSTTQADSVQGKRGCAHGVARDAAESERALPVILADSDKDGIPDALELRSINDRDNFRRWFTSIAETQFYQMSDEWNAEQRDCAGLVRFAWREALRRHDRAWFERMGPGYESVAPDVDGVDLEHNLLGEKIFRTRDGSFKRSDLYDGTFQEFADARTLLNDNCTFISRDRRRAEPGDLLFFHQPFVQKYPYHVMIFLGAAREADEGAADWVVYHTGATAADAGTLKKVRLSVLDLHPDKRWRPVEENRNFLGFYRLKILD